jgi:hypothetical protein
LREDEMICWEPVTLDCLNFPEPAPVVYHHEIALTPPQGFISCTLEDGTETMCPRPAPRPAFIDVTTWPDPCLPADPPQPGIGEILWLRTTAIDAAGNEDCGE